MSVQTVIVSIFYTYITSVIQKRIRQNFHATKLPYGKLVSRRNFRTVKYLFGKTSYGEIFLRRNYFAAKFHTAKFLSAKLYNIMSIRT